MSRAWNEDRLKLLTKQKKADVNDSGNEIFLTTTYNQKYGALRNQVESTWDLLGRSCTNRFIREKNLKVGYRRPKNLRDILVRARLPPESDEIPVDPMKPERPTCDRKNCRYCRCLNTSGKIQSCTTNKSHNAMQNVNCLSNNLVYCISCKNCGKQYVEQIQNSVRQIFVSHFHLIGHNKTDHEVPRHFNTPGHRGIHDVEIHHRF